MVVPRSIARPARLVLQHALELVAAACSKLDMQVKSGRRQAATLQRHVFVGAVFDVLVHKKGPHAVMGQSSAEDDLNSTHPQRFQPSRICTWRRQAVKLKGNDYDPVDGCTQGVRFLSLQYFARTR